MTTDHPFALCLTHDVDKPFKTPAHAVYYTLTERDPSHLRALRSDTNPYWQFEELMALEDELGVRSAFYFLNEPPVSRASRAVDIEALLQSVGRYSVANPDIADIMRELAAGGWEVGLHGSYHTPRDLTRLQQERDRIEAVLGHSITGGRQHYLNLSVPETWRHYRRLGLCYDASLGSRTEQGFLFGSDIIRPFDDDFVVFPLTLMEQHLPDPGTAFDAAWDSCLSLLEQAARENAVMTVLFHPRFFNDAEFPGYRALYRGLIEEALDMDAWVGAPGSYYQQFLTDAPAESDERAVPADQ